MVEPLNQSVRVRIYGRVQGVWFRGWTVREASSRGLSGWVRNRADGSVEAVFAGPEADVKDMIVSCRRGPPAARVDRIEQSAETAAVERGFHQRPDC
jgi:acylphosphatase